MTSTTGRFEAILGEDVRVGMAITTDRSAGVLFHVIEFIPIPKPGTEDALLLGGLYLRLQKNDRIARGNWGGMRLLRPFRDDGTYSRWIAA